MSVAERVPADPASTLLVIEDQFSNLRGESFSLRLSFPDAPPQSHRRMQRRRRP
jgi:hypothetical protein